MKVDVLIVGGGFIGGTLAVALAGAGLSVAVVDKTTPEAGLDRAFDGRASAIALASRRLFEAVGLWRKMANDASPIREIRVSDNTSPLFLHYDHTDLGDEPFGYMLENRSIRKALFEALGEIPGIYLAAPAEVANLERGPGRVEATLRGGAKIEAALAVGADGRRSATRRAAGIALTKWSYRQDGIVCTVAHERPHRGVAQERFLPGGPFAVLPLKGNRSSIVWTEREDLAPAIMALGEGEFLAELRRRFGDGLGRVSLAGPRWSYPLTLQYAQTTVARRLVLVGDAAHGMHPIAGQGMNMGLRDAAALAEVLVDAKRLGLDMGQASVLEDYERRRRFDNTLMLALTDGLNRLFSNDIRPLALLRDVGLAAVHKAPPLKKVFMRHAMGLAGDPPRLMRGEAL